MTQEPAARPRADRRPLGFASRLLVAQAIVLGAMGLTAWLVASVVGPGIFRDHLERAGVGHTSEEADHVEEAFSSAMLLALVTALLISVMLALVVAWYLSHRVQRSVSRVVTSAAEVAAGEYGSRLPSPGLGAEFDELTEAFNALAERLLAVESTRRRMLADLAHEMRTPLATLEAHLEALEDGIRPFDHDALEVLRSSTERLARLADDINAVSRAQERGVEIDRERTGVTLLVERALQAADGRFRLKGVTLRAEIPTDVYISADPGRMEQVLGNVLDNALRHTPPGGIVTVSCRVHDQWVQVDVTDTGDGIAAEHLENVFDRFYRADPSRHAARGTDRTRGGSGIGLTISKAIVEAHGGRMTAHSEGPGQGATFTIRLPGD